jgi:kynureninase
MTSLAGIRATPNVLARHYRQFDVAGRLLLTGHSHQAWPDRAADGQRQAWEDAAARADEKWDAAFARAAAVRQGFARLLGEPDAEVALGQNTFELVARFLSALPLADRPRLVTTDGEFHTIRRLLDRLAEAGVEVVKVDALPADTAAERIARAVDDRTAAVLVSSVYFLNAHIVPDLGTVAAACERAGARLLVDAYHHLNVVPFSIREAGLETAFVTGGGYKYCQLGEGNAFLRVPRDTELRPVLTGWFAEFGALGDGARDDAVAYGTGAQRFAGATYDPVSHYRAAAVFDFFLEQGLTPELLRQVSQQQVGRRPGPHPPGQRHPPPRHRRVPGPALAPGRRAPAGAAATRAPDRPPGRYPPPGTRPLPQRRPARPGHHHPRRGAGRTAPVTPAAGATAVRPPPPASGPPAAAGGSPASPGTRHPRRPGPSRTPGPAPTPAPPGGPPPSPDHAGPPPPRSPDPPGSTPPRSPADRAPRPPRGSTTAAPPGPDGPAAGDETPRSTP